MPIVIYPYPSLCMRTESVPYHPDFYPSNGVRDTLPVYFRNKMETVP
jgi:hypothetical protein